MSTTSTVPSRPGPDLLRRRLARPLESFPGLVGLALAAQLIVLIPVLSTAFWEDDDANSYINGYLRLIGRHFWPFVWSANKLQVSHFGRPMPLGVLQTYGVFAVIHDRMIYKALLIALTLLALRRLGQSAAFCALATALPAGIWQLHLIHDPLISYVGLVQTITIYTCASVLVFVSWLRKGGRWRLALVSLLTVCICVTYEAGYVLPVILILVAWRERGCSLRHAVVLATPGVGVAAAFLVLAVVLQHNLPPTSGYNATFTSPGQIGEAWAKIVTSGLPIIGWAAHPGPADLPSAHSALPCSWC
jgi:hypothetical protein